MTVAIVYIIVGLAILIWSGDRFVTGASSLARNLGISPMLIGLTIVAFGTSAPEIFIAIMASLHGNPGIAVGDAIGSNIANIGMVIGITALIKPIQVHSRALKREFPLLIIVSLLTLLTLWDGFLGQTEGMFLVAGLIAAVIWLFYTGLKTPKDEPMAQEFAQEIQPHRITNKKASLLIVIGLILLPISSRILVLGAIEIAKILGVSDLFIGLTIVAIGTSLPEAATSIICILKNESDIALGNILGSNVFNLLAVLGISAIIHPIPISRFVLFRDYGVMLAFTFALTAMAYGFKGPGKVNRIEGALLLIAFIFYIGYLIVQAAATTNGLSHF